MDFKDDIVGVQPPNFCVKCYAIITSSAKRDGNTSIVPILWIPHSNDCTTCELRAAKSKGGRPKKKARGMVGGRPSKKEVTTEDILKLDPGKPIPQCVEKALSHVISIQMKQSKLPNKSVQLSTTGPHHLTMTPIIHVACKDSDNVAERTRRSRNTTIHRYWSDVVLKPSQHKQPTSKVLIANQGMLSLTTWAPSSKFQLMK